MNSFKHFVAKLVCKVDGHLVINAWRHDTQVKGFCSRCGKVVVLTKKGFV